MDEKNWTDPPPCPHCGRCVLAGPPCCAGAAADARKAYHEYYNSPEYQALVKQQRQEEKEAKRKRRCAKFQRRLDRLAFRTWDAYDQFLADQSAWEGFTTKES